jgi:ribosomal protein S18 acetylase RimI-like enzyme
MPIAVRRAEDHDLEALLPALMDMERHYERGSAVDEETARRRLSAFLGGGQGVLLIALDGGQVLGFLSMSEVFPGKGLRPVWFMKELYVLSSARSGGVGGALVRAAASVVVEKGGSRLDFATAKDNVGAQKFYARMGAREVPALALRIDEATLTRLAERESEDLQA